MRSAVVRSSRVEKNVPRESSFLGLLPYGEPDSIAFVVATPVVFWSRHLESYRFGNAKTAAVKEMDLLRLRD